MFLSLGYYRARASRLVAHSTAYFLHVFETWNMSLLGGWTSFMVFVCIPCHFRRECLRSLLQARFNCVYNSSGPPSVPGFSYAAEMEPLNHCLNYYLKKREQNPTGAPTWILFHDEDEYLFPADTHLTISQALDYSEDRCCVLVRTVCETQHRT